VLVAAENKAYCRPDDPEQQLMPAALQLFGHARTQREAAPDPGIAELAFQDRQVPDTRAFPKLLRFCYNPG